MAVAAVDLAVVTAADAQVVATAAAMAAVHAAAISTAKLKFFYPELVRDEIAAKRPVSNGPFVCISLLDAYRAQDWDQVNIFFTELIQTHPDKALHPLFASRVAYFEMSPSPIHCDSATNFLIQ